MQGLCGRGNIDSLVEVVFALAVNRSGDVTGGIKGGAVALKDKAYGHIPLGEVNDGCTVIYLEKPHIAKLFNLGGHLVGIEGLALVGVKLDTELVIGLLVFLKRDVNEPSPKSEIFLVAVLKLSKLGAGSVAKIGVLLALSLLLGESLYALVLLSLNLVVDTDIELYKLVYTAVLNGLAVAPESVGNDKLTKLGAPVTEVVDADALIARKLVKELERVTDNGGAEMSDVEGLCNIGGGVIKNYCSSLTVHRRAVGGTEPCDITDNAGCKGGGAYLEVKIAVECADRGKLLTADSTCKSLGNLYGRIPERLCKPEAGQGKVTHRVVGGICEKRAKLLLGNESLAVSRAEGIEYKLGGLFL